MCKIHGMVTLVLLAVLLAGCGRSDGTSTGATSAAGDATAVAQSSANLEAPAAAVYEFLDAVRTANEEKATGLLSKLAREKTASLNCNVTPPASDTAQFTVGKVDYVGDDGARVACTWTDLDEHEKPRTDNAIWVLRHEPEGWRIIGVAAKVFPDKEAVVLKFEDPEDMLRQKQWIREELRKQAEQDGLQAQDQGNQEKANSSLRG